MLCAQRQLPSASQHPGHAGQTKNLCVYLTPPGQTRGPVSLLTLWLLLARGLLHKPSNTSIPLSPCLEMRQLDRNGCVCSTYTHRENQDAERWLWRKPRCPLGAPTLGPSRAGRADGDAQEATLCSLCGTGRLCQPPRQSPPRNLSQHSCFSFWLLTHVCFVGFCVCCYQ